MSTATISEPASCKPNISPAGRRMRRRFGWTWALVSVLTFGLVVFVRSAWYWRALIALPAALSAIGFLQAGRNTCVARAAEGTFEHDDFSKIKAPDDDVAASRKVATGIRRDTLIIGLLCGAIAAGTVFVR